MTVHDRAKRLRPTIGLSVSRRVMCPACGGDGIRFEVATRVRQALRYDRRPRLRSSRDYDERPTCWTVGPVTYVDRHGDVNWSAGVRALMRVVVQWSAHGHDLMSDYPEVEFCDVCDGWGELVERPPDSCGRNHPKKEGWVKIETPSRRSRQIRFESGGNA